MQTQNINDLSNLNPKFRRFVHRMHRIAHTLSSEQEAVQVFRNSEEGQSILTNIYSREHRLAYCEDWLKIHEIQADGPKTISLNIDLFKIFVYGGIFCVGTLIELVFLGNFFTALRFEGTLSFLVAGLLISSNCLAFHFFLAPDGRAKESPEAAFKRERIAILLSLMLLFVGTVAFSLSRAIAMTQALNDNLSKQVDMASSAIRYANFGLLVLPLGFACCMGVVFSFLMRQISLLFIKYRLVQVENVRKTIKTLKQELKTLNAQAEAGCHLAVLAYKDGMANPSVVSNLKDDDSPSLGENLTQLWKKLSPEALTALFVGLLLCAALYFLLPK